jgi:hypothetical protein
LACYSLQYLDNFLYELKVPSVVSCQASMVYTISIAIKVAWAAARFSYDDGGRNYDCIDLAAQTSETAPVTTSMAMVKYGSEPIHIGGYAEHVQ